MYRTIAASDDPEYDYVFWNDEDSDKFKAETMGCSCCSAWETLTAEGLDAHIDDLEKRLAEAKRMRSRLDFPG